MPLDVLFEDNHLLVVNKPAGMATQGAASGEPSLVAEAKEYLRIKYAKPGNVYLGVVSRLDALVTGVVVLARTSKAAARLNERFRDGTVEKVYWAVVEGEPNPSEQRLSAWIAKDEGRQRMHVVASGDAEQPSPDAQLARLSFRTLGRTARGLSLIEVILETGRKHQIRLQLSEQGHPIVGDRKYGAARPFREGIALHARRLRFLHPTLKTEMHFTAPLPDTWKALGIDDSYDH